MVMVPRLIAFCTTVSAAVIYLLPPPGGVAPSVMHAAALATFTLGLWATGTLPEYLSAILFLFFGVLLAVAPADVVMSGFHSSPVWLVFGGLILGVAVRETGLGRRIAEGLMARMRQSYLGVVFGIVLVSALLGFLVPSSIGRVMIILPIVLALAQRMGFAEGRPGRAGMVLAVPLGSVLPTFAILPANVPNIGMTGAAESIYGIHFTYGSYLIQHYPLVGPITVVVLPLVIARLFPDRAEGEGAAAAPAPMAAAERRLMLILAGALGLWVTDTLHGISPAWVSMGAALLCLMPRVGVMPPAALVERTNFGPWFFLAGMIGLGAVVAESGLGGVLGRALLPYLPLGPGQDAGNFASLVSLGALLGLVTTVPGEPAIMTALAPDLARATGWPLYHVLMAQVPAWSLILFPYQLPPLVITMQLTGVRIGQCMRLLIPLAVFNALVLVPLQFLWWRFLGYPG